MTTDGDRSTTEPSEQTGCGAESGAAVGPSPGLSPDAVVRAQIRSLCGSSTDSIAGSRGSVTGSTDDSAIAATGETLRTVFDFAAPTFRSKYGSLEGFAMALSGPIYERLLEATSIDRGPIERDGDRATVTVLARHPAGDRTYEFVLKKQHGGKYAGCWMTVSIDLVYDGVSPSFRRMPTVRFGDRERTCDQGERLRDVLLRIDGYSPYNELAQVANCGGNGLCGTCAVEVEGETDEPGPREQARLSLPPHEGTDRLRLSCQTVVRGDVEVTKHDGLWGQHIQERTEIEDTDDAPEPIDVTQAEYDGSYEYETGSLGSGVEGHASTTDETTDRTQGVSDDQ